MSRPLLVGRTRVTAWLEQPRGGDVVVALVTAHAAVAGPTVYLPLVAASELHGTLGGLLDLAGRVEALVEVPAEAGETRRSDRRPPGDPGS